MRDCEKIFDLLEKMNKLINSSISFSQLDELKQEKERLIKDLEYHLIDPYRLFERDRLAKKHKFEYVGIITSCRLVKVKPPHKGQVIRLLPNGEYENTNYKDIYDLGEGLTAVQQSHAKWYILDENGKEIGEHTITSKAEKIIKGPYANKPKQCIDDRIVAEKSVGQFGVKNYLIDKNARMILEPHFEILSGSHHIGAKKLRQVDDFILFDTITGKELDPVILCNSIIFYPKYGIALLKHNSNKVIIFDCKNRKSIGELDHDIDKIFPISQDRFEIFDAGYIWRIIDDKGIAKEGLYLDILDSSDDGIIPAQLEANKWILINKNGEQVSKREYSDMHRYYKEFAGVKISNDEYYKNGWYFIDSKENILQGGPYESIKNFQYGVAQVKKDGKLYYIDTKGNKVFYSPTESNQ